MEWIPNYQVLRVDVNHRDELFSILFFYQKRAIDIKKSIHIQSIVLKAKNFKIFFKSTLQSMMISGKNPFYNMQNTIHL